MWCTRCAPSDTTYWEAGRRGQGAAGPTSTCGRSPTDNQAITWLKTNRHLNKMYVRWLDEIEDFRFDVTHLPGSRNPSDPLSRRGFTDGAGPALSTGDADPESQQELFSRLGRDAPAPAWLAAVRARWEATSGKCTARIGMYCIREHVLVCIGMYFGMYFGTYWYV